MAQDATFEPTVLLSLVFAVTCFTSTATAAHLPSLLQAHGLTLAAALALAALVGPAQMAARLLEFGFLRKVHPFLSAQLATAAHPLGAVLLMLLGGPTALVFTLLHGAGNGKLTIAKGTLPSVIFGPHGYGVRQGLLMVPARVAQAFSPLAFGLAIDRFGGGALKLSSGAGLIGWAALVWLQRIGSIAREIARWRAHISYFSDQRHLTQGRVMTMTYFDFKVNFYQSLIPI